jgi:cytochrome P450
MVLRETVIQGQTIAPGDQVMTLLGAANRDPDRFSRPETLDLARDEGAPMSFGSGIHYCLGAALARLEGQVCFSRLLARFKDVQLADPGIAHRDSITLRGLARLPVTLTPA